VSPEPNVELAGCTPGSARSRIIEATFAALMEHGYAGTSTREIARRAKVSKRELYTLFGSKEDILAAMIGGRAIRMRQPLDLPAVETRAAMAEVLTRFGTSLLREGSSPAVMAVVRLAVAEAERAPELARRLERDGRRPTRDALVGFFNGAAMRGLLDGADAVTAASQFFALLWGDLQMRLLLRLAEPPDAAEIDERARSAVAALLALYPATVSRA
jgi:AcrR family transcriptional regulator